MAHRENAATKRALSDQAHAESGDQVRRRKHFPAIEVAGDAGNEHRQRPQGHKERCVVATIRIGRRRLVALHEDRAIEHRTARTIGCDCHKALRTPALPAAGHSIARSVWHGGPGGLSVAAGAEPLGRRCPAALTEKLMLPVRANAAHARQAGKNRERNHRPDQESRNSGLIASEHRMLSLVRSARRINIREEPTGNLALWTNLELSCKRCREAYRNSACRRLQRRAARAYHSADATIPPKIAESV